MKIQYNFEEIEDALMEAPKPKLNIKKKFWTGDIVLSEKNLNETLEYIEALEMDLELLRNFVKIQRKLESLKNKEEFSFENYIKVKSEEGYDEDFEKVRDEFEAKFLQQDEEEKE